MKIYKKMKFPFEVTKGKAEDLYRLRFMRKSELEPLVQHNLRHNVGQMGRQLDLWFKEQLFTIGSLNKEQEKLYHSRKRLKTEIRRSKKREYARHQEEIRVKLKDIKVKMLMMKVVQKFKENVAIARSYRSGENSLKGNVDVLRVSGNKQLIHGSDEKQRTNHGIEKVGEANQINDSVGNNLETDGLKFEKDDELLRREKTKECEFSPRGGNASNREKSNCEDFDEDVIDSESDEYLDSDDAVEATDYVDDCQRLSSSRGPRMETIPEESEEVEVEVDDLRSFPKLTKRRLNLLNRSQSKRNVFDIHDSVPLLPEVIENNAKMHSNSAGRHLPDTADKETQTSDKSKSDRVRRKKPSHLRRSANQSDGHVKRTIVVKLPRSKIPTPREPDSTRSTNGSDESDDENSTDFAYGFESDLVTTETDNSDDNDVEDDSSVNKSGPGEFSFSLYKTTLRRKDDSKSASKSLPSVNIEANFPNITAFSIQNPFSVRYKERSFILKTSENERSTGSAKFHRKSHEHFSEENSFAHSPRLGQHDKNTELKKKRSEEIRKLLMQDNRVTKQENPNIAIFGKRPDGLQWPHFPSPPTSPEPVHSRQGFSPRRSASLAHNKKPLFTHMRAKAEEQEKIHDIISSEPVQKYERTRSGKIRPFGTPRIINHEIPSLRDQYYRDKLLKAERDSILKQNIKMRRFMDTFEKGGDCAKLPTVSGSPGPGAEASPGVTSVDKTKKTLGNFLFKVYQPEQNVELERKVVPGVSTTSLRLLKNCRYLREYRPMEDLDRDDVISEKKTSWDTTKTRPEYSNAYLANVRVNLIWDTKLPS